MIVINIELWPHGFEEDKQHLGTAVIYNDRSGTSTRGNYKVFFGRKGQISPTNVIDKPWRKGVVKNFPRKRLLAWDLLHRAINNSLEER